MSKNSASPYDTGMLAFERSIQISEALMSAATIDIFNDAKNVTSFVPVEVHEKGVRGQTANDTSQAKLEKEMKDQSGKSNIQTVHNAVIPQGHDALVIDFDLRILPRSREPHSCDDGAVARQYRALSAAYAGADGYEVLAVRYLWNLANGRFAWRNRFMTDHAQVCVTWNSREIRFDPLRLDLEQPDDRETMAAAMTLGNRTDLDDLIAAFAMGLSAKVLKMHVRWISEMGAGQEVFPSQEYLREETKALSNLSRVYAILPIRREGRKDILQASIHSQKIGAAIRHVDDWHGYEDHGVIAANPYGGVQNTGEILRDAKNKKSLYDLRRNPDVMNLILSAKTVDELPKEAHFIMANLVRGGVFGAAKA